MKSLFPSSNKQVEKVQLADNMTCDVYVWVSPENVKIAAHMIFSCPACSYPLSLATSEFDFDSKTLSHKIKCPARWKKTTLEVVDGKQLHIVELNEKARPIFLKCGWRGYIVDGQILEN